MIFETGFEIARLPFKEAQAALLAPASGRPIRAVLGWHGQELDPRLGSYALVAQGGPCGHLAGERVRVSPASRGRAPVYAYVLPAVEDRLLAPAELTVTRRLFMALALASADALPALVEVVS